MLPQKIGMRGLCAGLSTAYQQTPPMPSGSHERLWMTVEYEHQATASVLLKSITPGAMLFSVLRIGVVSQGLARGLISLWAGTPSFSGTSIVQFLHMSHSVPS